MRNISKFYFDRARYRLADQSGNEIFLDVNYRDGKFEVVEVAKVHTDGMALLKKQIGKLAQDLILRKHNVNFSAKIKA